MLFRGAVFDLDGVIVCTDKYHFLAWKELADREGIYFDEKINVPFPSGSEMSGQTEPSASVRYRKRFELTAFECSGTVLLNFLNVDGAFGVVLNGVNVFSGIKGGCSSHFDVSRIVREGVNELTVFSAASPANQRYLRQRMVGICREKLFLVHTRQRRILR